MQPSSPVPHTFNYPALRVVNPSLPTPPLDIVEKKRKTKRLKADSPAARAQTQARFRPAGYTSSAAWLREDNNDSERRAPKRMVSMAFPNPHDAEEEEDILLCPGSSRLPVVFDGRKQGIHAVAAPRHEWGCLERNVRRSGKIPCSAWTTVFTARR